ncbi:hypothetical protein C8R45DRAFT_935705 [Mycena sanguinolenta]|nr:hypothetical protein C8R45DRAFT_935705 [Mycena sanguinolenta]
MVNHRGNNGVQNGERAPHQFFDSRPPDDVLKGSLMRYASLQLTVAQKLENLAQEHNYHIKSSKLAELNREFNVPTARKPPPISVVTTLVCDKLDQDINQANGSDAIRTFLALDGFQIPRDTVRQVMKDNAPGSSKARYPGNKEKIIRKNLTAQGVFQEVHFDGHEKLSSAALRMGPGIAVYGARDKDSSVAASLVAVPDARQSVIVGHLYLDFVQEFGAGPVQVTVDKGSETGEMYAAHKALRETFMPDLDPAEWPEFVALKSVNNIPIENLWKWLLKTTGRSLREFIEDGKTNGLFNSGNEMHIHLFHWLWSKIVQIQLDQFKLYWNHHTPRKNPKKNWCLEFLPSRCIGILKRMDALRENLPYSREEVLRWVPDSFDIAAKEAYEALNSPKLEPRRGWEIFGEMASLLQDWENKDV